MVFISKSCSPLERHTGSADDVTGNPSPSSGHLSFSVLRFALTIIHGCGRAAKNGEGLVSFIRS